MQVLWTANILNITTNHCLYLVFERIEAIRIARTMVSWYRILTTRATICDPWDWDFIGDNTHIVSLRSHAAWRNGLSVRVGELSVPAIDYVLTEVVYAAAYANDHLMTWSTLVIMLCTLTYKGIKCGPSMELFWSSHVASSLAAPTSFYFPKSVINKKKSARKKKKK